MKNTDEINNTVESIINNYNHAIGHNAIANDDESIKLIRIIYQEIDNISETDLIISLFRLCETVSVYKIGRDINCTYALARLCYKISRKLIVDYDNTDAVYAMFLMAKERLFELYLLDKNYYRHVASAFYAEMEVDSFAYKFGFYDAREIYENLAMTSVSTKVDVDHIIIADIYASIGIQMQDKGLTSRYIEQYVKFRNLSDKFWTITKKSCIYKIYNPYFAYLKLYKECMVGKEIVDGINEANYVLAFVIADINSKFVCQRKIAKKIGAIKWNNIIDRRKLLLSSKILLGIAFTMILLIVVALVHDKSFGWTIFVALCFGAGACSYYFLDDKARTQIYHEALVRYDIDQIVQAAQRGIWHEPIYLSQWGNYYYNLY